MELTHTWKLFLTTINLLRGRLAPTSAPHAGALALAGAMPADGEGAGEVRTGCLLWPREGGLESQAVQVCMGERLSQEMSSRRTAC